MPPTSVRATACVSVRGLCVTEWGNPPLALALLYGDVQGKGGREGENWRVEPGGKGCAVIRSLRGGMHSVVETLSLRIRAEPPNSPAPTEGRERISVRHRNR